jgi:hypothetical protein
MWSPFDPGRPFVGDLPRGPGGGIGPMPDPRAGGYAWRRR